MLKRRVYEDRMQRKEERLLLVVGCWSAVASDPSSDPDAFRQDLLGTSRVGSEMRSLEPNRRPFAAGPHRRLLQPINKGHQHLQLRRLPHARRIEKGGETRCLQS